MKSFFEQHKARLICFDFVKSKKGGKMPKRRLKQEQKNSCSRRCSSHGNWPSILEVIAKLERNEKEMRKCYLSKKSFIREIYAWTSKAAHRVFQQRGASSWLSSRNFFRGSKIYCYANFFCYANCSLVFGPNFRGRQKSLRGKQPQGHLLPPCGRKPVFYSAVSREFSLLHNLQFFAQKLWLKTGCIFNQGCAFN